MTTPTTARKLKLVRLLARYILTDGARIRVQERAYNAYMSYFLTLEKRYPQVAWRSDETQVSLVLAAKRQAAKKLFRGPGMTK